MKVNIIKASGVQKRTPQFEELKKIMEEANKPYQVPIGISDSGTTLPDEDKFKITWGTTTSDNSALIKYYPTS
jgi:hypothetical protein